MKENGIESKPVVPNDEESGDDGPTSVLSPPPARPPRSAPMSSNEIPASMAKSTDEFQEIKLTHSMDGC